MKQLKKSFNADQLLVKVYEEKTLMAESAASYVAQELKKAIIEKGAANLILATGASQFSFLEALKKEAIKECLIIIRQVFESI